MTLTELFRKKRSTNQVQSKAERMVLNFPKKVLVKFICEILLQFYYDMNTSSI